MDASKNNPIAEGKLVTKTIIKAAGVYKPLGPYSQAVKADTLLYVSGVLGMDKDGQLACGGAEVETRKILENLKLILEASGASLESVIKTTILLQDMNDFVQVNQVYAEYFKKEHPARATYQVAKLPAGAAVEIEAVALCGKLEVNEAENEQNITEVDDKFSDNEHRNEIKDVTVCDNPNSKIASKQNDAVQEIEIRKYGKLDETLVRNTSKEEAPSLEIQHHKDFQEKNEDTLSGFEEKNEYTFSGFQENNEDCHEQSKILCDIDIATESDLDKPTHSISKLEKPENQQEIDSEEKISTLEEVVDKVVEFYIKDNVDNLDTKPKDSIGDEKTLSETIEMSIDATSTFIETEERAPSPSESSSSSRATRWEALADIAAELPPSLTVDPVTGQIYALSK